MNSKKWIFSKAMLATLMIAGQAFASTTKVGNGDDGRDLEGTEAITSGIIFETRVEAVEMLKALNVQGIAGLGLLIPELEHTDLLMVKEDVRPVSADGATEISGDREKVFARTFAEPHAPTRFFPAAAQLTRAQLIALHVHEALHRSLAAGVREDEDKVSFLTMSITSPSATFDRVNRVAAMVEAMPAVSQPSLSGGTSLAAEKTRGPLPPSTRGEFSLSHTSASAYNSLNDHLGSLERLGIKFSPGGMFSVGETPAEVVFAANGFLIKEIDTGNSYAGPVGFTLSVPFHLTKEASIAPLVQVNLVSLDKPYNSSEIDRDVLTVGGVYDLQKNSHYLTAMVTYTKAGTYQIGSPTYAGQLEGEIASIWSGYLHSGFKVGSFSLGMMGELHRVGKSSRSYWLDQNVQHTMNVDPYALLLVGPEIKWAMGRTSLELSGKYILNHPDHSLEDLGDIAGHGTGAASVTATLAIAL